MPVTHYKPGDAGFDDIAKTVTHVTKVRKEHSGTRTYIGADVGPIVCGRLFNTHGCSEKEYKQEVIVKRCGLKTCNKPLYKRDDEPFGNWKRRKFCDKSCAATSNAHQTKPIVITVEAKVHAKCYVKGTPEFNAIAQLYGG